MDNMTTAYLLCLVIVYTAFFIPWPKRIVSTGASLAHTVAGIVCTFFGLSCILVMVSIGITLVIAYSNTVLEC